MLRLAIPLLAVCLTAAAQTQPLRLNALEYFERPGVNVMAFQDIYPEGHQGGVNIIQHGVRVASNGDLRLEPTPGQWQPVPKQDKRTVNAAGGEIVTTLSYPDPDKNRKGFNPVEYPDLTFAYTVRVKAERESIRISVNLDKPLPAGWQSRVSFNLELYPSALWGKTWYLDQQSGIFPRQPNGPMVKDAQGELQAAPLATGRTLSVAPDIDAQRLVIESRKEPLQLIDGRNKHNNGWFVVRSLVAPGATENAIEWIVTPHAIPGWKAQPVVHVSQVGYHPKQSKIAIIELDPSETAAPGAVTLRRISENGGFENVLSAQPAKWGKFLRYQYLTFDFTKITRPGMYVVDYGNVRTEPFQISPAVFDRHVWQPVLEYFLPAQMCHMRVEQQYRVWHDACHLDDARMAPVNLNHFDGYVQGASTLTRFKPGEEVPGLNAGGWHDAGDDDFRIESQADEVHILASAYEAFRVTHDNTTIDQTRRVAKIHEPDGKPDILQQVEHGILTILGGYRALGRVYRGIIVPTLPQYVLLGDTVTVTDNLRFDSSLQPGARTASHSAVPDDRWVFTEQNAGHEYKAVAAMAIAGRVLRGYNDTLAAASTGAAEELFRQERDNKRGFNDRILAAVELWLTTNKPEYGQILLVERAQILSRIDSTGWMLGRVLAKLDDKPFVEEIRAAVAKSFARTVEQQKKDSPFGVPYRPHIWGAGWNIQRFGVEQYFLHKGFPSVVTPDYMFNALNFVLGVHPGENTASFASGVGSRSLTIAYGFNRADFAYIPGGVGSGTALIRPDFPELKDFPFLWQQTEYVMGGGSSNYMFLVLAAQDLLRP
jgi:hypothetical protein